ncbi:hypothetical protein B0H14DRAFT_2419601, partial [Mycena olivaceomarginata]
VLEPLAGHTKAVTSVAFSPDGRCLVSSSIDRSVRVWNLGHGEDISLGGYPEGSEIETTGWIYFGFQTFIVGVYAGGEPLQLWTESHPRTSR